MNRDIRQILAIAAFVTLLILAVIALRPGTTETVVLERVELPQPGATGTDGDPIAVVTALHEEQETSFFGLIRGETHHIVSVQFYAPPACIQAITQDERWPTADADCSTEVVIDGIVSGTGIAPTGETIIFVDTPVTEDCYATMSPGDFWPAATAPCS